MAGEFSAEGESMVKGLEAGLYQFALMAFARSQVYVPVEYGVLKASGRVFEPVREGDEVSVTLGYGWGSETRPSPRDPDEQRPAGAYAIPVHERTELRHAPPTRAKYLEDSVLELAPEYEGVLAASIQRAAVSGGALTTWMEEITATAGPTE